MKIERKRTPLDTPLKALISVHGNVATPEYLDRIEEVSRKGWGTTFWGKDSTTNWFHLPFTLPTVLDGAKPKLTKAFFFTTRRGH